MAAPGSLIGFVPTADAEQARRFYVDTLGLEFVSDDGFALMLRSSSGPVANVVRLARTPKHTPVAYTVLGWESTQIESDVRRLSQQGVSFARYGFLDQDELGIWTAPSGDKVAWFQDPDGNTLSLSQHVG